MESQRDLDRAKGNNQNTHQYPRNWQIIKDTGNVREIGKKQRQPDDQHAYRNDNPSPFQDITKAAHGEAKELSFFEADALYPGQTDGNEIHLDVDSQKVFENECGRIDRGRDSQEPGGRDQTTPLWQSPEHNWLQERRQRAQQQNQIGKMTPETITLPQCPKQCAVQSTPVSQHEHGGNDRKRISCRGVIENACHSLEGGQR